MPLVTTVITRKEENPVTHPPCSISYVHETETTHLVQCCTQGVPLPLIYSISKSTLSTSYVSTIMEERKKEKINILTTYHVTIIIKHVCVCVLLLKEIADQGTPLCHPSQRGASRPQGHCFEASGTWLVCRRHQTNSIPATEVESIIRLF